MPNHSYENDFDLHENETACRTHFHMKGSPLRLALKQRQKRTRKWPIDGFRSEMIWTGSPVNMVSEKFVTELGQSMSIIPYRLTCYKQY